MWREGRNVLYAGGRYTQNLMLARAGVLPFFLLAAWVVWMWTRRLSGDWAAALAVGLFVSTEPVLAHAGFATLDLPLAATCAAALFALTLWLERHCRTRSLLLGITVAAAVVTKFSSLAYLPAAAAVIALAWWYTHPRPAFTGLPIRQAVAWAAAAAALTVWAAYRFSIGPVTTGMPVPAPEFWRGIGEVLAHQEAGWEGYLLGQTSTTGWWYFFPVALAVKTPIPFLWFLALGATAAFRMGRRAAQWMPLAPAAASGAILLVSLRLAPSIGLRQILPVYPLAAVTAGWGAWWILEQARDMRPVKVVAGVLLTWQLVAAVRAFPDFLPWFNVAAGKHPERILVGSDLDWGQDLFRLVDTVQARGIDSLALAYFGSADPTMHFAHVRPLAPYERAPGWSAVSIAVIKGLSVPGGKGYEWLDTIPPSAYVGASIRLYHFRP